MKITIARLKELGACRGQVRLFEETFGPSVIVTEALCAEHADKFSWIWVAVNFLPEQALKAYNLAEAPAWEAYNLALARAFGRLAEQQED